MKSRERTGHGRREAVAVHSRGGLARRGINTLHCHRRLAQGLEVALFLSFRSEAGLEGWPRRTPIS